MVDEVYFCCACMQKGLLNINIKDVFREHSVKGHVMHLHTHKEKLKCPYKGCGKSFGKPTVLTDSSTMPRETYYACPYCNSKIDIVVEGMKIVEVKSAEYQKVFESPAKCVHYFGFLNAVPSDAPIPDECLICPKVFQCSLRKR